MPKPLINKVELVDEDKRGSILRHVMKTEESLIVIRKKGTVSGKHYHGGKDPAQNPEVIVLVTGSMDFVWKNMKTGESGTEHIDAPAEIVIPVAVYHEFRFKEPSVMLEPHSVKSERYDTYWPKNI